MKGPSHSCLHIKKNPIFTEPALNDKPIETYQLRTIKMELVSGTAKTVGDSCFE
jgi:hypothetical protein